MSDDIPTLRRILKTCRTIAIVGLSAQWHRPSFFAAKYMQEHGYRIVPVNPRYPEVLGERCYASLRDIPHPVDMVDVFRATDEVGPVADDAIAIGAKCLWQQLGVRNLEADARARAAGLSLSGALRANDSYHFFEAIGGLYKTGPTRTNVCDLHLLLVE